MADIEIIKQGTGKTSTYIKMLLNRKRRASANLAVKLENITGIDRRAWIWPDEFPNPLINSKERTS